MPPEETQVVGGEVTETAPVGMDMDAALTDIAESLSLLPEEEAEPKQVEETPPEVPEKPVVESGSVEPEKVAANSNEVPPDTWRKEAKEAWATVPPVVREELRKREADIASYVERVKQPVAVGEKLNEVIGPYLPMFEKTNTDPWANISAMFKVQERLLYGSPEEKLTIVSAFAEQAGLKLDGTSLSAPPDGQARYVKALEDRLATLEGGVKQVTSTVHQARVAELQQHILKFAQDTEAHPYFNEVADKITHLVRSGACSDLEEAYQTAVAADPVVRQKYIDGLAAQAARKTANADAERVAKARNASKAVVRSTSRGAAAQPPGSIDDTLKDTLAAINSRTH